MLFINYFEGEQQSVILTEYLEGGELFQRISSADYTLTEAKCRDFIRQIVKGNFLIFFALIGIFFPFLIRF